MNIECPKCNQTNEIEFSEHISCKHCSTNFKGFSFVKKKITAILAAGTIGLGLIGGYEINDSLDFWNNHRYPLAIEFALVDTCINSRAELFTHYSYKRAREQCLCAIDNTTKKISYHQYQNDIDNFNDSIQYSIQRCKN